MPRTVPVSATQAPGNLNTSSIWNAGPAASNTFLTTVPKGLAIQTSAVTSTGNNGWTAIGMDGTSYDSDGGHSNTVNNTRYTCQVAGVYLVNGSVAFTANSSGNRGARIQKNGSPIQGSAQILAAINALTTVVSAATTFVQLAVGDYVEVAGFQSSGGTLNTFVNTDGSTSSLIAEWVST